MSKTDLIDLGVGGSFFLMLAAAIFCTLWTTELTARILIGSVITFFGFIITQFKNNNK